MYGVSDVDHCRLPLFRSLFCKSIVRIRHLRWTETDCSSDQALVLMREHARTTHHRLADIADAVLAHRIWFSS